MFFAFTVFTIMVELLYSPNTDFHLWSTEHYTWLAYFIMGGIFWITWGRRANTEAEKRRIGLYMALVGVIVWVYSVLLMFSIGNAPVQSVIPLHLCYFFNLLFPVLIWQKKLWAFDWVYPIVMAGCLQALFTPDLNQAAPHYYSLRYWFVHAGLIHSILYAIFVFGFRPTFKGIFKCMLAINIYALCVTPINMLLDTNFLYLRRPAEGSIMEVLGPWPQYLMSIEVLMFVFFTIAYLPFLKIPRAVRSDE